MLWTCHFYHGFWLKSLRTLFHVFSYHVLSFLFKTSALLLNHVRSWKVAEARDPGGLCTAGAAPSDSFSPFVSPHLSGGLTGTRVPPPKSALSYPFPESSFLSDLLFSFFHPPRLSHSPMVLFYSLLLYPF